MRCIRASDGVVRLFESARMRVKNYWQFKCIIARMCAPLLSGNKYLLTLLILKFPAFRYLLPLTTLKAKKFPLH